MEESQMGFVRSVRRAAAGPKDVMSFIFHGFVSIWWWEGSGLVLK